MPTLAPIVDTRTYFDYHHSAADTLDKIDPDNIRRQVALMAMMAYFVADMPDALPRLPPSKPRAARMRRDQGGARQARRPDVSIG